MAQTVDYYLYTPSGRAHFMPGGRLPQVGDRLAQAGAPPARWTALRSEGPITSSPATGRSARCPREPARLADRGSLGDAPRWGEGTRYRHGGASRSSLSPPERQALFCALVLGILEHLDVRSLGHYTESAKTLLFGHALRHFETGLIDDRATFEDPSDAALRPSSTRSSPT